MSVSIFRTGLLQDQVILITGGGTGIGRTIACEVAALGGTPVIVGRREEHLLATRSHIERAGGQAEHYAADIRNPETVQQLVVSIVSRHGRIDGLVNNAGGQFPSPAGSISSNGWRSVVDLNLTAVFEVTKAVFLGSMAEHGGAVVTIVASMFNGFPGFAHSGAARAGAVNLTKSLASEWASHRVRVNAVAPGIIASSGLANYPQEAQDAIALRASLVPAGRPGSESEVSSAVVFLLSAGASYITGATLTVDGGSTLAPAAKRTDGEPFDRFDVQW